MSQVVSAVDEQRMQEWIRDNKHETDPEKVEFPAEWLGDTERAKFCQIAFDELGEQPADMFLKNVAFRRLIDSNAEVIEDEIGGLNRPAPRLSSGAGKDIDLDELTIAYVDMNEAFYIELLRNLNRAFAASYADPGKVADGISLGIAYALNAPADGLIDQRLNFFVRKPIHLMRQRILSKASGTNGDVEGLCSRIEDALNGVHVSAAEQLTKAQLKADFILLKDISGEKHKAKRGEVRDALSKMFDDGSEYCLKKYLFDLVYSGSCDELNAFIDFHCRQQIMTLRTKEGRRRKIEMSITLADADGDRPYDIDELSVTEEHGDDGTSHHSAAARRLDLRQTTTVEIEQVVQEVKRRTRDRVRHLNKLILRIADRCERESIGVYQDFLRNDGKRPTESDRLSMILPEILRRYLSAATAQIDNLICHENAHEHESGKIVYRAPGGRRAKVEMFRDDNKDERYVCLADLIDHESLIGTPKQEYKTAKRGGRAVSAAKVAHEDLVKHSRKFGDIDAWFSDMGPIAEWVRSKLQIYYAMGSDKTPSDISKSLGQEVSVVKQTMRQIKIIVASKKKGQTDSEAVLLFFVNLLEKGEVKNAFAWRWDAILEYLYEPVAEAVLSDEEKSDRVVGYDGVTPEKHGGMYPDDYFVFDAQGHTGRLKRGTRLKYHHQRFHLRRRYRSIDQQVLYDLESILFVHAYLKKGTLPKGFYGKRGGVPQPGEAWGHNESRVTGETKIRMYYDIFFGGLDRNNPEHRDIRKRAARVWQVKRAKVNEKMLVADEPAIHPTTGRKMKEGNRLIRKWKGRTDRLLRRWKKDGFE